MTVARERAPGSVRRLRSALADVAGADPAQVAQGVLDVLLEGLTAAGGALVLMHPQTGLFWTGAVTGMPAASCHPFFGVELSEEMWSLRRMALTGGSARALRLRDAGSALLTEVAEPYGFSDELRSVFRAGGVVWGGVSLWHSDRTFGEEDEVVLDAVAETVGARLRDAVLAALDAGAGTAGARGMLLVEDGRIVGSGLDQLGIGGELEDGEFDEYRHVDHLLALVARDPGFSTVIRGTAGVWLSAQGIELGDGRVAILLNAATPAELLGARVVGAGLTQREIEVTRLLCRGLSDAEIAVELFLSPHTVHDHVRAVRRKLGVRSRAAVASRVFSDAYFDSFLASAAIKHAD
jgi:DNA-binding CsgD family transcriptional regulator